MKPIIAIGLTEDGAAALERIVPADYIHIFPTAESATYALQDALNVPAALIGVPYVETALTPDDGAQLLTYGTGWDCHVAYGEGALGPVAAGHPERLAHTGKTLLVLDTAGTDGSHPRRVIDGEPQPMVDRRTAIASTGVLGVTLLVVADKLTLADASAVWEQLDVS